MLAVVGCVVACNGMRGGEPVPISEAEQLAEVETGALLFRSYCVSCHGLSARGDGLVAYSLNTRPPDLTRIAARRGGEFDAAEIAAYIDGRIAVDPHGRRDMPVWGRRFDERNPLTNEPLLSREKLFSIVQYLDSIQENDAPPPPAS